MAKGDKIYFDNFTESIRFSHKAANYLVECLNNYNPDKLADMLETMHEIEHSADKKKHEMNDMLIRAFVTPVDREDLDLLSHSIDNVSDTIEEILQKFYIYNIKEIKPEAVEFAQKIVYSCELLDKIMVEFENFKKSKTIQDMIVELNSVEEDCDRIYLTSMRKLTIEEQDVLSIISWRMIFESLEECADTCEHVAECVRSVIMKNT